MSELTSFQARFERARETIQYAAVVAAFWGFVKEGILAGQILDDALLEEFEIMDIPCDDRPVSVDDRAWTREIAAVSLYFVSKAEGDINVPNVLIGMWQLERQLAPNYENLNVVEWVVGNSGLILPGIDERYEVVIDETN